MKKKMIGRVSALTVAGVMMFGGMQIPAMAATGDSVVQFQKVLQMENAEGANVPNVTYTYTITAGSAIGATANSPEVKAGVGFQWERFALLAVASGILLFFLWIGVFMEVILESAQHKIGKWIIQI